MEIPKESLYITTVFFLRLLWDAVYEDWSKAVADKGLTVTEEQILWVVWLYGSGTVTEVARSLQRDKGTISKSIYSLEESGLVVRGPGVDRRSYEFRLTSEGEKIRESLSLTHGRNSVFAEAFEKLPEDDQRRFVDLALKLAQNIEGETYISAAVSSLARVGRRT